MSALFYECVWIRKQTYFMMACSGSGSRGNRDEMRSVFACSQRIFVEEVWSAGLRSSRAGADADEATQLFVHRHSQASSPVFLS